MRYKIQARPAGVRPLSPVILSAAAVAVALTPKRFSHFQTFIAESQSPSPPQTCACVCVCAREHARACTIYGLRIIRRDVPRCSSSILCDDINVVSVGVHMRIGVRVSVCYGSVTVVDVVGVVVARRRRRATVVCLFAFALLMSILE